MRTTWMIPAMLCSVVAMAEAPVANFNSFNDWVGSEARGVRIGADGRLRLAPNLRRVAQLPEGVVWAAVPDGSGGLYLSAGTEGKIFHYTNGQVKPLAQVKGGIVFAMARVGQELIVAPSGENKLFKVSATGDVKPFAEIDARLVWAIAVQGSELFIAGGNEKGAVLVLAREGSSRKLAEQAEETSFTCIAPDGKGGWYLGSHGHGLLLRYLGQGGGDRLETIAATGFEEVRTLVVNNGDVYLGVDNGLANRIASGTLEKRETFLSEPGSTTKGAVIRVDSNRVPATLWQSSQSQIFTMQIWNNQILVGTGNRSRIFSIPLADKARDLDPFALLQDLGTAQATALLGSGSDLLVVGSNPAEIHVLSETQATEGTLESRPLRGIPLADWGRSYLDAEAVSGTNVELQFRVGSTEVPDGTWSTWTPPLRSGERTNLPATRFSQFRLRLSSTRGGATPVVEGVRVHWANRNLAPLWESMEIMPPGLVITRNAPPDDIGVERIPYETQRLIPALGYLGAEKRSFRRSAQAFVFKVSDPNGDQLSYEIKLIPEKGNPILLEKNWRERFFTFDTLPVPDGRYRLEAIASDWPSEPFNLALSSTWRTAPFTIDHTPPVISDFTAIPEGEDLRLRFVARDEGSVLKDASFSADGEGWLLIAPEDRVFDMKEERFDIKIPRSRVQGDRVSVRAVDACGMEQTASVIIGDVKRK